MRTKKYFRKSFKAVTAILFLLAVFVFTNVCGTSPTLTRQESVIVQKKNNKKNKSKKNSTNKGKNDNKDQNNSKDKAKNSDEDSAEKETETESISETGTETEIEYKFRNARLLEQHFEKHGGEFDYETAEEYEAGASAVVNNKEALHKTEKEDGDDVYYLEETNEFVVVSVDGYIRTYFKPNAGIKYYNRQ